MLAIRRGSNCDEPEAILVQRHTLGNGGLRILKFFRVYGAIGRL